MIHSEATPGWAAALKSSRPLPNFGISSGLSWETPGPGIPTAHFECTGGRHEAIRPLLPGEASDGGLYTTMWPFSRNLPTKNHCSLH